MKKIIAVAVAAAAIAIVSGPEASAQSFSFNNGYQFGAGAGASGFGQCHPGFGFGTYFGRGMVNRPVRPPYFAEFPPVYYSGIVRRPYGISPYAAPAGVVPVEMNRAAEPVEPVAVKNPFFDGNHSQPVSVMEEVEDEKSTKNKSTRVANPFFNSDPEMAGPIIHASFDAREN